MPSPLHTTQLAARGRLEAASLLIIVVGAHPQSEWLLRPVAYHLRKAMADWLDRRWGPRPDDGPHPCMPLVCTDVWYLNDDALRARPTISIGGPEVNALSAYLLARVPVVFSINDRLAVHLDIRFQDLSACCWGVDAESAAAAVDAFAQRYLAGFMDAATRPWP